MAFDSSQKCGSLWRKWDIQIQPIKNAWLPNLEKNKNAIKKATREYLQQATDAEMSVVAITDHNCGMAVDAALQIIEEEGCNIKVLPGVEIDTEIGYQLLIIFNPAYREAICKDTWEDAVEHFLNNICNLPSPVINMDGQAKSIGGDIHAVLTRICKEDIGVPVFAHCQSDKGLFKKATPARRQEYFNNYLQGKYYFALDHKSDESIEATKETIKGWGMDESKFAYVKSSDSHQASLSGSVFSWIKADPTFEGLRQIIYEPMERIRIQIEDPSLEYNKPYFSKINIKKQIGVFNRKDNQVYLSQNTLTLNKNLVTIIGGRGTGKSILIDYWASIFEKNISDEPERYSSKEDFCIEYAKDNVLNPSTEIYCGNGENYLDFIYIPQSQLKEVSQKDRIEEEVKQLLDLENLHFSQSLNSEIQSLLENINKLDSWFLEEDEKGRQWNQAEYIKVRRAKNEKLLLSITTQDNREKLKKYTDNISAIEEVKNSLRYLNDTSQKIVQTQRILNSNIDEINLRLSSITGSKKIESLSFKSQLASIEENIDLLGRQEEEKRDENEKIKADFEKEGFVGDLVSLLKNARMYQANIKDADQRLSVIEKKEEELQELLVKRNKLAFKFKDEYEKQKGKIDKSWRDILEKHEGAHKDLIERILLKDGRISVEGEIVFDQGKFYEKLLDIVDKRTYKDIGALKEKVGVSSFDDWVVFVNAELKNFLDSEDPSRSEKIMSVIFSPKERKDYLRTTPKIKYDSKNLDRLSAGQRGTVYLCLKLATHAFSKPIIFDQPEDDLDNQFIVNELIGIFRQLKYYRQIIIATHNANLVVNADAEQIIIADNVDEKLFYTSGSLENPAVINKVCNILEGGEEAFERRKNRYHLN
ncbi:MAG: hypothetical protein F4X83_00205 [Chloroflexi bacterium]|nr:hypothetical protein [Chloroflexota bacterium]